MCIWNQGAVCRKSLGTTGVDQLSTDDDELNFIIYDGPLDIGVSKIILNIPLVLVIA
jgi:hypothetical protein